MMKTFKTLTAENDDENIENTNDKICYLYCLNLLLTLDMAVPNFVCGKVCYYHEKNHQTCLGTYVLIQQEICTKLQKSEFGSNLCEFIWTCIYIYVCVCVSVCMCVCIIYGFTDAEAEVIQTLLKVLFFFFVIRSSLHCEGKIEINYCQKLGYEHLRYTICY